jgi:hypothetical protein
LEERAVRDFLWRYWYTAYRRRLALALIALAVLAALLLIRRLRVYRTLTVTVLLGGIVVVGWLLVSPLASLAPTPLVIIHEKGAVEYGAATAACGTERDALAVLGYIPEPSMSTWGTEPKGTCVVRYRRTPDAEGAVADATCGTKRDLAAVLKHIPEPATGTWGLCLGVHARSSTLPNRTRGR